MRALLGLPILVLLLAACGSSKHVETIHVDGTPPKLTVTHPASGSQGGFLFLAEKGGKDRPSGPLIVDDRGRIRWYHQVPAGLEATDFRTQTYKGKPVLTWWQGTISKTGVGKGEYEVYDASYHHLQTIKAAHGLDGDLHEFQLTPRGTAFISVYETVPRDLTAVGGPRQGFVYDSIVQEIDLDSGKPVFEWHSLDHVPLEESLQAHEEPAQHASKKRPLDYFHVNSVADAPGGGILVSARNTSALYLVARDGHIVWRLGGKKSDFHPAAAVKFRFQHNARFHGPGTITLFDNGAIPKLEPFTRPLVLKIDQQAHTAAIVKAFVHPTKISSPYEGNLQLLAAGGALVGWGGVPKVTQFDDSGTIAFELKLPYGDTYRAYRLPWSGDPGGKPAVAVHGDRVVASWNGRMDVDHWDVLAGPDKDHLARVAGHAFSGLETTITLETPPQAVQVRAVAADGRVIGNSDTAEQ